MAAIRHLKVVGPANVKRTVALPVRKPNAAYRSREHLTEREVQRLVEAAKDNRWGHRDSTMVLLAFRHGLRASELVDLRWEQVDLENAILHVRRVKQGTPATHPLTGRELRALRRLRSKRHSFERVRSLELPELHRKIFGSVTLCFGERILDLRNGFLRPIEIDRRWKTPLKQRQHIFKGGNHLRIDFPQPGILFCHLPRVGCQLSKVAFKVRHNNPPRHLVEAPVDRGKAS